MHTHSRRLPLARWLVSLCCAIVLCWGGSAAVLAQRLDARKALSQYQLDNWQRKEGLQGLSVTSLLQSRNGYIWAGTLDGLHRFDGVKFRVYNNTNTPGLLTNGIWTLLEDSSGGIWMGTNGGGLSYLKDDKVITYTTKQGLVGDVVNTLFLDSKGNLWVGTKSGISVFRNGRFENYSLANGLQNNNVLTIAEVAPNTMWVGTREGMYEWQSGSLNAFKPPQGLPWSRNFNHIYRDSKGTVWIASDAGLYRYRFGRFSLLGTAEGLSNLQVSTVMADNEANIWVGTYGGGLQRMLGGRFTALNRTNGLKDPDVRCIMQDHEGSVWFGTYRAGLYRLRNTQFINYGTPEGLPNDVVFCVLQDRDKSLWAGTGEGLVNMRENNMRIYNKSNGMPANVVRALHQDADGSLWVGTYEGGIAQLRNGVVVRQYNTSNGLPDNYVRSIIRGPDGMLWIGTRNGLCRMQPDGFRIFSSAEMMVPNNSIMTICNDGRGNLWIGTDGGGLTVYRDNKFRSITTAEGLLSGVVMSFYADASDSSMYVGTSGGLSHIKGNSIYNYSSKDGQFPGSVFQMTVVDDSMFWMGCNQGLFTISKQKLTAYRQKKIDRLYARQYDQSDGMRSSDCVPASEPNIVLTENNRIYVPTAGGLVMVNPHDIITNMLPPPLQIQDVIANGTRQSMASEIDLEPGNENLEIHYAGLSYLAPDKVRFKYKLEGYDNDWIDAGSRRVAYYTNLAPRRYVFHVIACNNDGVWSTSSKTVILTLRPFFYQSIWFYFVSILLIGGSVYFTYRWRIDNLRMQKLALEQNVAERTLEIRQKAELLEATNRNITTLSMIGRQVSSELDFERLFQSLYKGLQGLMDVSCFGIDLYHAAEGMVEYKYNIEYDKRQPVVRFSIDDPISLSCWCVRNKAPVFIEDMDLEYQKYIPQRKPVGASMRSIMFCPLLIENKVLGCIAVESPRPRAYTRQQFEMLQSLASYTAIALENATGYRALQEANAEIARQNKLLAGTLDELTRAQKQLILSDKMAALGLLMANVAHEINTPLSAIVTTTRNNSQLWPILLQEMPPVLAALPPALLVQFQALLTAAEQNRSMLSSKDERAAKRGLEKTMQEWGAYDPLELAQLLVAMRITEGPERFKDILLHPQAQPIILLASQLVQVYNNNDLIRQAAEKTAKIVSALKNYTHSNTQEERQPTLLTQSLDNVLVLYENQIKQGIQVVRNYRPNMPLVPVYADELDQVWTNMIHNAILAMQGQGTLQLDVDLIENYAVVRIIDSGSGIPPEVLPRIFDAFFTTRPKGQGTGLGLDISKKIIEKHHGKISVNSVPGHTKFEIRLPLQVG